MIIYMTAISSITDFPSIVLSPFQKIWVQNTLQTIET